MTGNGFLKLRRMLRFSIVVTICGWYRPVFCCLAGQGLKLFQEQKSNQTSALALSIANCQKRTIKRLIL